MNFNTLSSKSKFKSAKNRLTSAENIPLNDLFSQDFLNKFLKDLDICFRNRIFNPFITLWTFINQILSSDHSCRNAVTQLLAARSLNNQTSCSTSTGAYCQARAKLPEDFFSKLTRYVGQRIEEMTAPLWKWKGFDVYIGDGTTVILEDTKLNQKEYPQSSRQKEGLGFPILRIVGLFSLSTGILLDAVIGPYQGKCTGETTLFRQLLKKFKSKSIILLDRYYAGFPSLWYLQKNYFDFVIRQSSIRIIDYKKSKKIGKEDYLIQIPVGKYFDYKKSGITEEEFNQMPEYIELREIKFKVYQKGFRDVQIKLLTTLTNPKMYSLKEIALLYKKRWNVEVNFRSMKCDLNMEKLRCKTPEMVRKELWTHLMAYNFIRLIIVQTSLKNDVNPWEISFKAALQAYKNFRNSLITIKKIKIWNKNYLIMLDSLIVHKIGQRPDRYEPRAKKYRGREQQLLTKPRNEARKEYYSKGSRKKAA